MQVSKIWIALLFFVGVFTCFSCKKVVDKIKENLLADFITGKKWIITKYTEGTENKTADYTAYQFQFNTDRTIDAIKDGTTIAKGSWDASQENQSVTATFTTGGALINKLSGTWIITNTKSAPWRVYSHRFEGSTEYFLDMQEKE